MIALRAETSLFVSVSIALLTSFRRCLKAQIPTRPLPATTVGLEVAIAMRTTVAMVVPLVGGQSAGSVGVGIALRCLVGNRVSGATYGTTGAVLARPPLRSSSKWLRCNNRMRKWLQKCNRCAWQCRRGRHAPPLTVTAPPLFLPSPPTPGSRSR